MPATTRSGCGSPTPPPSTWPTRVPATPPTRPPPIPTPRRPHPPQPVCRSGGSIRRAMDLDYTLQNGLNLGLALHGRQPGHLPDGQQQLHHATGGTTCPGRRPPTACATSPVEVNADGTVTIWAATSTVSGSGDQGADPNAARVDHRQPGRHRAPRRTSVLHGHGPHLWTGDPGRVVHPGHGGGVRRPP